MAGKYEQSPALIQKLCLRCRLRKNRIFTLITQTVRRSSRCDVVYFHCRFTILYCSIAARRCSTLELINMQAVRASQMLILCSLSVLYFIGVLYAMTNDSHLNWRQAFNVYAANDNLYEAAEKLFNASVAIKLLIWVDCLYSYVCSIASYVGSHTLNLIKCSENRDPLVYLVNLFKETFAIS